MANDIRNIYQLSFSGPKVDEILVKADGIKVLGASTTILPSDVGLVKVDGITIKNTNGTLSDTRANTILTLLPGSAWVDQAQTVLDSKITENADIIVAPDPQSMAMYTAFGVYCVAQASGSLTFSYTLQGSAPTASIYVDALIWYNPSAPSEEV